MEFLQNKLDRIDAFQRRHVVLAFPLAVVKKYSDDNAKFQAATLAYYGFLSLFPLLLVLTSVVGILLAHNPGLRQDIISGALNYFPVVGVQLNDNINGLGKSGLALAIGLILTLYGARGVADAFRRTMRQLWQLPDDGAASFPLNIAKNLAMIVGGGLGLLSASLITGFGTTVGGFLPSAALVVAGLFVLFVTFIFIIKLSLPIKVDIRRIGGSAATMAVGLVALQSVGGYIVTHELKHLNNIYGTFAVVLGLLFWIFLQAQVVILALEVDLVREHKLWPRRLLEED